MVSSRVKKGYRGGVVRMLCLCVLCLLLIAPISMWAQNNPQKPDSSANNSDAAGELGALRESLSQTQRQVASQQEEIEALKHLLSARQPASAGTQQEALEASNAADPTQPIFPSAGSYAGGNFGIQPAAQGEGQEKKSPLSFKIGSATFTPGGFVDIENIFRTTNTQNNIATNFASIPFSNTPQGNLTEYRLTAQFSRFNITVRDKFGANDMTGYCEADFSGNDATNVYQTVNGHTLRVRLCFLNLKRGKWEVLGGQTWSWLTPNRKGVGPMPADDLWITYNEDQNIVAGFPYTRAAEFRVAYHLNDHWAMGLGIENPNQFIGGFVALPAAFSTTLAPSLTTEPKSAPPIFSGYPSENHLRHRNWKQTFPSGSCRPGYGSEVHRDADREKTFTPHSAVGGGGQIATNFQLPEALLSWLLDFGATAARAIWWLTDRNWFFARTPREPTSALPWCMPEPDRLALNGTRIKKLRSPSITVQIISGAIFSRTPRTPPIRVRSLDMAGLVHRTPTTGPFSKRRWIGCRSSGKTQSTERCSITFSILT